MKGYFNITYKWGRKNGTAMQSWMGFDQEKKKGGKLLTVLEAPVYSVCNRCLRCCGKSFKREVAVGMLPQLDPGYVFPTLSFNKKTALVEQMLENDLHCMNNI